MTAGSLRRLVTLRRPDSGGTWGSAAQFRARVESTTGDLDRHAGGVGARERLRVTFRHRTGVLPGLQLRIDGNDYDILAVLDRQGTRRWLTCICERLA